MATRRDIYVTQPDLPDFQEFIPYLEDIWSRKWLTNNGIYHKQLEKEMADFLGVNYISLFANGTLALLTALQALRITGEVITTPYSFVATTNALWWNNVEPVFVDVDPVYGNLDPKKIEEAITPKTIAILPVHVYGKPCQVEKIQKIADIYGLKVIYDAAHSFGCQYKGQSLAQYGDLGILSFHATKAFNTMEGGAIVSHDQPTKQRIDYLKNFGIADEVTVMAPGINSKMNEMQAALGLLQLKYFHQNVDKRKKIANFYIKEIENIDGVRSLPDYQHQDFYNYSYFPVFIDEKRYGVSRNSLYNYLKKQNIFARRYFYPTINNFPTYRGLDSSKKNNLINAEKLSNEVLCLPMYSDLTINDAERVIKAIKKNK